MGLIIKDKVQYGNMPFGESSNTAYRGDKGKKLADNLDMLQSGLAIVVDGDSASAVVPVNRYAYIKNNTHGLVEGLYINTGSSDFPVSGGTADSSTFTAANGILNTIISRLVVIEAKNNIVYE